MDKEFNRQQIVAELNEIAELYDANNAILDKMDHSLQEFDDECDKYRTESAKAIAEYEIKKIESFPAARPAFSSECMEAPSVKPSSPDLKRVFRGAVLLLSGYVLAVLIPVFLFLTFVCRIEALIAPTVICMFFLVVPFYLWSMHQKDYDGYMQWEKDTELWKKTQEKWESDFDKAVTSKEEEQFFQAWKAFDAAFLAHVSDCDQCYKESIQKNKETIVSLNEKYQKQNNDLCVEGQRILEKLKSQTLIHIDLVPIAWRIAKILETKRADSLKEAINLALDDERKDKDAVGKSCGAEMD